MFMFIIDNDYVHPYSGIALVCLNKEIVRARNLALELTFINEFYFLLLFRSGPGCLLLQIGDSVSEFLKINI